MHSLTILFIQLNVLSIYKPHGPLTAWHSQTNRSVNLRRQSYPTSTPNITPALPSLPFHDPKLSFSFFLSLQWINLIFWSLFFYLLHYFMLSFLKVISSSFPCGSRGVVKRIGSPYDPCGSYKVTEWSRVDGLGFPLPVSLLFRFLLFFVLLFSPYEGI